MVVRKMAYWLSYKIQSSNSCHKAALMKVRKNGIFLGGRTKEAINQNPSYPNVTKCPTSSTLKGSSQTLVCEFGALLRCQSLFPYFMLVAFEGGSVLRAFLLLLSFPVLWVLDLESKLRVMIFISFCGLRLRDVDVVARAVLPKFYLENINVSVYEALDSAKKRLVFTSLPRVMVESFLRGYLLISHDVDTIKGTELRTVGQFFTGFLSSSGLLVKHKALNEFCGENLPHVGIGSQDDRHHQQFLSLCKEAYVVHKDDLKNCATTLILPRARYPKPLIFHDGRLAFFPTPLASLKMFLWLPFGIILAPFRILVAVFLPYKLAAFLMTCTGVKMAVKVSSKSCSSHDHQLPADKGKSGVLYVCNHRTLVDPAVLLVALDKPLTAVTYSLSKFSELIAPIRTVSLRRDRIQDGKTIQRLLREGDLVVCPEGTTCREPYLLRFSSLFAELTDEIVPVAIDTRVDTFYGTTASGFKWLDPIYLALNFRIDYSVRVLDKLPKELTVSGGKSSHEVANFIQKEVADALGFECTNLTRKDKYMMLVGNEGLVQDFKERNYTS